MSEDLDVALAKLFGARAPLALRYAEALSTSGVERGLIGPREVPRVWERHILNCAAMCELVPPSVTLVDVGSGAGLPGLVLAIARPDVTVTLLEPLLRRVTWLEEVIEDLGLDDVEIVRDRAEDLARQGRLFDVATARAVAPLGTLAGWCLPLVRPGGRLLAIKGDTAAAELADAQPAIAKLGGEAAQVVICGEGILTTPTTVIEVPMGTPPPARRPKPRRR